MADSRAFFVASNAAVSGMCEKWPKLPNELPADGALESTFILLWSVPSIRTVGRVVVKNEMVCIRESVVLQKERDPNAPVSTSISHHLCHTASLGLVCS